MIKAKQSEKMLEMVYERAKEIYGFNLPQIVEERLSKEVDFIIKNDYSFRFMLIQKIVAKAKKKGYTIEARTGTDLLVSFLLGIIPINPLQGKKIYKDIYKIERDEIDMPFQAFIGFTGGNFTIVVPQKFKKKIKEYLIKLSEKENENVEWLNLYSNNEIMTIKRLQDLSGVQINEVPLNDEEVLSLFNGTNKKGLNTLGIPHFGNSMIRGVLNKTKPNSFDDLVKINAIMHGTGTWTGNGEFLVESNIATLSEIISSREDLMIYLMNHGIERKIAYEIMCDVSIGRVLNNEKWDEYSEIMKAHDIPMWYIKSCEKIKYLWPKSICVLSVYNSYKIAWYKVHHSYAFEKIFQLDFYKQGYNHNVLEDMISMFGVPIPGKPYVGRIIC